MAFKKTVITLGVGCALGFGVFGALDLHKDAKANSKFEETVKNIDETEAKLQVLVENLKSKMNEYSAFPVSYSTAPIKCFSKYTEDVKHAKNIFTGEVLKNPFNKDKDWVLCEPTVYTYAQADSSFNHDINLSTSNISLDSNNLIVMEIDKSYLNTDSISLDMKTYKELEAETVGDETYKNDMNNDAKALDLKQNIDKGNSSIKSNAQRAWQVKCVENAPDEINKLYETDENRKKELEVNTIESVKKLMNTILVDTLKELDIVSQDVQLEVRIRQ